MILDNMVILGLPSARIRCPPDCENNFNLAGGTYNPAVNDYVDVKDEYEAINVDSYYVVDKHEIKAVSKVEAS